MLWIETVLISCGGIFQYVLANRQKVKRNKQFIYLQGRKKRVFIPISYGERVKLCQGDQESYPSSP